MSIPVEAIKHLDRLIAISATFSYYPVQAFIQKPAAIIFHAVMHEQPQAANDE